MKSLISFILKHLFGIVFIVLEFIAFYLIYQSSTYTSSVLLNASNELVGKWYDIQSTISHYFYLKKENRDLAYLNTQLLNKSPFAFNYILKKEYLSNDTIAQQEYTFITARVINSTFNSQKNYITLNVGKNMGIERDMAVITDVGIVGSVKDVSEHYATVITLLHKDFLVNCMLKDGTCGPLSWDGVSRKYLHMNDVPLHAKIKIKDTVYTSHFSHLFPMGIPVGTIESYERKQKNPFYTLQIKIFTDFNSIQNVYVVKHIYKKELDSLQTNSFQ